MFRIFSFVSIVFVLGAFPAVAGDTKLTGEQIRTLLVGNTIYWQNRRGREGAYYFGTGKRLSGKCCAYSWNRTIRGTWRIENNKICESMEQAAARNVGRKRCLFVVKNGDDYSLKTAGHIKKGRMGLLIKKFKKGNPDGL